MHPRRLRPKGPYKIHVPGVEPVEVPRLLARYAEGKNIRFKPPVALDLQASYEAETDDLLYSLYGKEGDEFKLAQFTSIALVC